MLSSLLFIGVLLLATGGVLSAPQSFGLLQGRPVFNGNNGQNSILPMRPSPLMLSNFQLSRPQGPRQSILQQLFNPFQTAMKIFDQIVSEMQQIRQMQQLQQAQQQMAILSSLAQQATQGPQVEQNPQDITEAIGQLEAEQAVLTDSTAVPGVVHVQEPLSVEDIAEAIEESEAEQAVHQADSPAVPQIEEEPLSVDDIAEAIEKLEAGQAVQADSPAAPNIEEEPKLVEGDAEVMDNVITAQTLEAKPQLVLPPVQQNPPSSDVADDTNSEMMDI